MKNSFAFAFLAVLCGFAFAGDLYVQYAGEVVTRDCGQMQFALANRSEFSQFVGKQVDSQSVFSIVAVAAQVAASDESAQNAPVTYMTCGEYVLAASKGKLYWRGFELVPPAYLTGLESTNAELEGRVSVLESQLSTMRAETEKSFGDLRVFLIAALIPLVVALLMLYQLSVRASAANRRASASKPHAPARKVHAGRKK